MVVIVTWFHGTGGLPHHLSALVRNDSDFHGNDSNLCGKAPNTNLMICNLEYRPIFQHKAN